jgi:hypothetical protein
MEQTTATSKFHDSKIRFQILSDLHLEFTGVPEKVPPIEVRSDYLALLGITFTRKSHS